MIEIKENLPLAPLTTFKIGGVARYFVEVKDKNELLEVFDFVSKKNLKYFILGGGSNLLISDKGFDGVVIKIRLAEFNVDKKQNIFIVGSGVPLAKIVKESATESMSGMEWAAGIPGTVGGAIRGNARAFGKDTGSVIESVEVLDVKDLKIKNFKNNEFEFSYWGSIFKKKENLVILSAKIKLESGDKNKSQEEITNIIKKRMIYCRKRERNKIQDRMRNCRYWFYGYCGK